jgi:hypothetical protein
MKKLPDNDSEIHKVSFTISELCLDYRFGYVDQTTFVSNLERYTRECLTRLDAITLSKPVEVDYIARANQHAKESIGDGEYF